MTSNGKLLEMHARQRLGMPDGWRVYNFDTILDDRRTIVAHKLIGAVAPIASRGARVGLVEWHRKDPSTEQFTIITPAEHEAWVLAWEARTGLCRACLGRGEEIARMVPPTYAPCSGCLGTGKRDGRAA